MKEQKQPLFYGWVMVAVAAMGVFFSGPGQTYSNSMFIDQLIADFNWSRTEVSGIYSLATFSAGIIMMFVGRFIDRFGQRLMMVSIGVLFSGALMFNSFVSSLPMLFFGFFLIRLLGQGSMTLIPNTLVAQWFIKKRGLAFSLMSLGGFISSALFPIINAQLIGAFDWAFAWRFWAVLVLIMFVPISLIFVRNRPEDIGLEPDGVVTKHVKSTGPTIDINEVDWTLAEAMKTKAFWFILFSVAVPAMINTGITLHIASIFKSQGLTIEMAAIILSMMAFVGIPMSFMSGFIFDRIDSRYILMAVFGIEVVLLLLLTVLTSNTIALIFGLLWGIGGGLERITLKAIWPAYFGRRYIGAINGVSSTATVIASSLGPLPFGFVFDMFGSYRPILLMMLIFPVVALIFNFMMRQPKKSDIT